MIMERKFRIKTEEEFIKEHGSDWRKKIFWDYNDGRDSLLGEVINDENVLKWLNSTETHSSNVIRYKGAAILRNDCTPCGLTTISLINKER